MTKALLLLTGGRGVPDMLVVKYMRPDIIFNITTPQGLKAAQSLKDFVSRQFQCHMEIVEVPERIRQNITPPAVGSELIQKAKGIKDGAKAEEIREQFGLEDAVALLQYEEFNPLHIVLAVGPEYPDAQNWNDGNQHRCIVESVEEREEGIVVFCKPAPKKDKDKKKKKK